MQSSELPGPLLNGAFTGPTAFSQCVRDALTCAAQEGWAEMVWSDANFENWPLHEKAVVESLNAWARGGRRLVLMAQRFDVVQRFQPRFVSWRITWDHIVECRICPGRDTSEFPSALWSPHWVMTRLDTVRSTGVAGYEAARRVLLKQDLDEIRRHSAPGFPASTLGL